MVGNMQKGLAVFLLLLFLVMLPGNQKQSSLQMNLKRVDLEERQMFAALPFSRERILNPKDYGDEFRNFLHFLDLPESYKDYLVEYDKKIQAYLKSLPPVDNGSIETAYLVPSPAPRKATGELMAGAARVTLNPERLNLPVKPDPAPFWWRKGRDLTTLPGYGHFNSHLFQVLAKLKNEDNFYSHLDYPSEGTLEPDMDVEADAVVLQDPQGQKICIVGSDTIGMIGHVLDDVIAGLWERGVTDFTRENLLLSGTHTHTGPGAMSKYVIWWLATVDLFVPEVYNTMVHQFVDLIVTANNNLQPAQIGVGSGLMDREYTHNRRNQSAYPPDPIPDQEIGVIRVDDLNGNSIAAVFNFAMHGTTLGDILQYSPENWGYVRKTVETLLGPGVVGIPVNGAEGDVAPSGQGQPTRLDDAKMIGERLGSRIVEIYEQTLTTRDVSFATSHCQSDDPDPRSPSFRNPCIRYFEPPEFRVGFFAEFEDGTSLPGKIAIPIDDIRHPNFLEREGTDFLGIRITEDGIKNSVIVTFPGEGITDLGFDVKARLKNFGFDQAFVFGLANGHISYIVNREEYWEGGYESGSTFFGETTGEVLSDNAVYVGELLAP